LLRCARGVQARLGGIALEGESVDLGLLFPKVILRFAQRRNRAVQAALRLSYGVIGLLLRRPRRRLLVRQFGAGPL
jgi:hypothetical protein